MEVHEESSFSCNGNSWNMGFCQLLIIHNGETRPIGSKTRKSRTIYRAMYEKDGKLRVIESKKEITYEDFVKYLKDFKVKHALYLDMGSGWNHARYRDKGKGVILHPKTHNYCTNWLHFTNEEDYTHYPE